MAETSQEVVGETIRIRGRVQGVGFRPTVARVAGHLGLNGFVRNDGEGVLVALVADSADCDSFLDELHHALPPLARIDAVERTLGRLSVAVEGFSIMESETGGASTEVAPDAGICNACWAEVRDPSERRYRYPFTNCTNCGPRYSIIQRTPYDRVNTTMSRFPMCSECHSDYRDPSDRRYHAQPVACHRCGPRAWLERSDARAFSFESFSMLDEVDAAATLLLQGEIIAVKGLGAFHLCCDATNEDAVRRLRQRKRRPDKPFAMMVRDLGVLGAYARFDAADAEVWLSAAAPILLLPPEVGDPPIASSVAPEQRLLGFMVAYTPLHRLMLQRVSRPIVCTSGNLNDESPCTDNDEAKERLGSVADWFLFHNRPIARVVEDSVVRVEAGHPRVMRRGRGYVPRELALPESIATQARILALGAEKKGSFALCRDARIVLSGYLGNLDEPSSFAAWTHALDDFCELYDYQPDVVVIDCHPEYRATQFGYALAEERDLTVVQVAHHHAHIAACLVEHGHHQCSTPVLGIALDGLGMGPHGELWGGEFLLADYAAARRVGSFKAVALLGGDQAARQPWRNLYAHLRSEMSWPEIEANFGDVPSVSALLNKRSSLLESMLTNDEHAPRCSSAGRLFDAVAACLDLHFDEVSFEGQAAMALEALVDDELWDEVDELYPIATPRDLATGLPYLECLGMWRAILGDLWAGVDRGLIAARFHRSLVDVIVRFACQLRTQHSVAAAVLAGGVWQNRWLLKGVQDGLEKQGFEVLVPREIPVNDEGISAGQVAVAAARHRTGGQYPCV